MTIAPFVTSAASVVKRPPYVLALAALLLTAALPEPGLTWDEPTYVAQGMQYVAWTQRFFSGDADANDPVWTAARPDHPPLGKFLFGSAIAARPGNVSAYAAARAVSAILFVLLVWLTTWAAERRFGSTAAWLAGGSLMLTPPVIAHAQFAALDLPVAVAWLATAAASLAGPTGARGALVIGVLWGLALLTKVNGIFLAVPIFAWGLATERLRWRDFPLLYLVGVMTFFVGWPWLWDDTLARVSSYLLDKQVRWIVPSFYLGEIYQESYPPWHYPLVLMGATLPVAVVIGALAGIWVLFRERPTAGAWVAVHLLFTLGLACLPGVPRYDGTRLFLPAFPFVAILAGAGLAHLLRLVSEQRKVAAAITAVTVASMLWPIVRMAPVHLSTFSPLVGGLGGAARLGLEPTFWGDAITPRLLAQLPQGARIGVVPMGIDYARALESTGWLPQGSVAAPEDRCDVLIILNRKSMLRGEFLNRFRHDPAIATVEHHGVELVKVVRGN